MQIISNKPCGYALFEICAIISTNGTNTDIAYCRCGSREYPVEALTLLNYLKMTVRVKVGHSSLGTKFTAPTYYLPNMSDEDILRDPLNFQIDIYNAMPYPLRQEEENYDP